MSSASEPRRAGAPRERNPFKPVDLQSTGPLIRRLWQFARPHRRLVWAMSFLLLINTPLPMTIPLIIRKMVDDATQGGGESSPLFWGAIFTGIVLVTAIIGMLAGYVTKLFQARVIRDLRLRLYTDMQALSHAYFNDRETGYLMSRHIDDVNNLQGAMADTFARALTEAIRGLACVVLVVYLEWRLAVAGTILLSFIFGFQYFFSTRLRRASLQAREQWSLVSRSIHEGISGFGLIKSTASEERETERFTTVLDKSVDATLHQDVLGIVSQQVVQFTRQSITVVTVLGGVYLIIAGDFTVGSLIAFLWYLNIMSGAFGAVAGLNPTLQRSLASLERIFEVLDTEPEIVSPIPGKRLPTISGELRFEDVSFEYGTGEPVLFDIALSVPRRSMLALVGPSGAGKSTLAHLVPRFFDPVSGRVTIDGVDLRDLDLHWYRQHVGLVPQEIFLFDRSIAENIAYGSPDVDRDAILRAAASANALEFIEAMPEGFDTLIGERGVRLSGGQRQRIAIAREFLRNPEVLILDEATSSLDSQTEALIQEALDQLLAGRTSIVIAHRLSTVISADMIVAMEFGRVAEVGTHQELLARDGLYARLYRSQFAHHAETPIALSSGH